MSISGAGFGKGIPNFDESEEAKSDGPLKIKKRYFQHEYYSGKFKVKLGNGGFIFQNQKRPFK